MARMCFPKKAEFKKFCFKKPLSYFWSKLVDLNRNFNRVEKALLTSEHSIFMVLRWCVFLRESRYIYMVFSAGTKRWVWADVEGRACFLLTNSLQLLCACFLVSGF